MVRARQRGVVCRVLFDHLSNLLLRGPVLKKLGAAGIPVHQTLAPNLFSHLGNRIDLRNHRKIAVVDGRVAYVGSQNLVDAYGYKGIFFVNGRWLLGSRSQDMLRRELVRKLAAQPMARALQLITRKPMLYVANTDDPTLSQTLTIAANTVDGVTSAYINSSAGISTGGNAILVQNVVAWYASLNQNLTITQNRISNVTS